jgi:hypothetical protein
MEEMMFTEDIRRNARTRVQAFERGEGTSVVVLDAITHAANTLAIEQSEADDLRARVAQAEAGKATRQLSERSHAFYDYEHHHAQVPEYDYASPEVKQQVHAQLRDLAQDCLDAAQAKGVPAEIEFWRRTWNAWRFRADNPGF